LTPEATHKESLSVQPKGQVQPSATAKEFSIVRRTETGLDPVLVRSSAIWHTQRSIFDENSTRLLRHRTPRNDNFSIRGAIRRRPLDRLGSGPLDRPRNRPLDGLGTVPGRFPGRFRRRFRGRFPRRFPPRSRGRFPDRLGDRPLDRPLYHTGGSCRRAVSDDDD